MKTFVIRQRVADFLKRHSPFESLSDADLLELAGSGRVKFHEAGEYVFRQGQPKAQFIWVVQQGRIELLDERAKGEPLRDVLGEGDVLGFDRFIGDGSYLQSARTASDVIVYGLSGELMESLMSRIPAMKRFLTAHFSVHQTLGSGRSSWLDAECPPTAFFHSRLGSLSADMPEAQASGAFTAAGNGAVALTDYGRGSNGFVTPVELCEAGRRTVRSAAPWAPTVSSASLTVRGAIREMLLGRSEILLVTDDGTPDTPLEGLVSATELAFFCGENPVGIVSAIRRAKSRIEIAPLWGQADRLTFSALAQPTDIDDCCRISLEFAMALAEASIRLANREQAQAATAIASVAHCWILLGASARGDLVGGQVPTLGVIFADSAAGYTADHFKAVTESATALMRSMGAETREEFHWPDRTRPAMPFSEWKQLYGDTIRNPFGHNLYEYRELFDVRPIGGDRSLVAQLEEDVASDLQDSEYIVSLLANDTLAQLPPLTFFQGLVLEFDGAERESFDVEEAALVPLAAAARVFALSKRQLTLTNTLDRLQAAALDYPERAAIFTEAADAFRMGVYYRSLAGSQHIRPANLRKVDQLLLKTAIVSIHNLLEFTASTFVPET
jgi:CBS domain-containing protein